MKELLLLLLLAISIAVVSAGSECNVDRECPYVNCKTARCLFDSCVYDDVVCESASLDADACLVSTGCDVATNQCRFERMLCDDGNSCTTDICARDATTGKPYCAYERVAGDCLEDAPHAVLFENKHDRKLSIVKGDEDIYRLCHTTKNMHLPEQSVVVLSFDEYAPGTMDRRGTCDNVDGTVPAVSTSNVDKSSEINVAQPLSGSASACTTGEQSSVVLDGVLTGLLWKTGESVFTDLGGNRVRLQAQLVGEEQGFDFALDAYYSVQKGAAKYFYTPLDRHCYSDIQVNTSTAWTGYRLEKGRLMATSTSLYDGLVINFEESFMQVGYAASGANTQYGMHVVFTWTEEKQPHNPSLRLPLGLYSGSMRATLDAPSSSLPKETPSYCALFDKQGEEALSPTWTLEKHDDDDDDVIYCTDTTLDDLLRCRSHDDKYTSLFSRDNDPSGRSYIRGQLHHAVVHRPEDCQLDPEFTERVWSSTTYDLAFIVDANPEAIAEDRLPTVVEIGKVDGDIDFEVRWLSNTWLCCTEENAGNLQISLETITQGGVTLSAPRVYAADGNTIEFAFVGEERPVSTVHEDGSISQEWTLRTYNAHYELDFSSKKTVGWTVDGAGVSVLATLFVSARHMGSQEHIDDRLSITSALYTDRGFTEKYTPGDGAATDKSQLYGLVCLDEHRHLDLVIQEVELCYSADGDLMSCSQDGAVKALLYSRANASTLQGFALLNDPPSTTHCEGFVFVAKAHAMGMQRLRIRWSSQEVGGDGGLIEMFNDADDHFFRGGSWQDDDSQGFFSRCPAGWRFDRDERRCRGLEHEDHTAWLWFIVVVVFIIGLIYCSCRRCHDGFHPFAPISDLRTEDDASNGNRERINERFGHTTSNQLFRIKPRQQ